MNHPLYRSDEMPMIPARKMDDLLSKARDAINQPSPLADFDT